MKLSVVASVLMLMSVEAAAWTPKFPASGFVKKMPNKGPVVPASTQDVPKEAYVRGMDLGKRPIYGIKHTEDDKMFNIGTWQDQGMDKPPSTSNYASGGMKAFASQAADVPKEALVRGMDLGKRPVFGIKDTGDNKMLNIGTWQDQK